MRSLFCFSEISRVRALKFTNRPRAKRWTEQEFQSPSKGYGPQVGNPDEVMAQSPQQEGFEGLLASSLPQPGLHCCEPTFSDGRFQHRVYTVTLDKPGLQGCPYQLLAAWPRFSEPLFPPSLGHRAPHYFPPVPFMRLK